ncbi:hypothetical protein [Fannyhessea vaginae]|nr:hypothetical protein [Fannyhessea vaginae]
MLEQFSFLIVAPYACIDEVYSSNTMLGIRGLYPSDDTYVRPKFW